MQKIEDRYFAITEDGRMQRMITLGSQSDHNPKYYRGDDLR